jgi:Mg2+ and Co2+ transporter CorA
VIRGLGLYTPDDVLPLDELDPQELSTDEQLDVRLRDLRTRCDQLEDGFIWIGLFEPTRAELDLVTRVFDIPSC